MAGAPQGNTNAIALKTDELKLQAYRQYCAHIASGREKKSWKFQHPDLKCTWQTMERYIKENPIVLDPIEKQFAEADSLAVWEEKGLKMMHGEMKAETALYQMFMRNKFGWDKEEKTSTEVPKEFDQHLDIVKPNGEAK